MTLILAALTDRYVALASDRRMTVLEDNTITRQEDTDTKTFNICGHFLMGFTGLARIDGYRTERWVCDVLAGRKIAHYFGILRSEITAAFQRLGHTRRIPHAFLAVGFARSRSNGELSPVSVTISNSLDDKGRFTAGALQDEFHIRTELLGNRRQHILSVGWPVTEDTASTLDYRIRIAARGKPRNPALAVAPLVLAVRETARMSQDHVGRSVLFASLPKSAVPAAYTAYGAVDMRTRPAALFLPEDVKNPRKADSYGPAIVCPGFRIMGVQSSPEGWIGPSEGY